MNLFKSRLEHKGIPETLGRRRRRQPSLTMWEGEGRKALDTLHFQTQGNQCAGGVSGSGPGVREGRGKQQWLGPDGSSPLLLPPASLLEGQVDDGAIGHVVVSQRVGVLDEDALENRRVLSMGMWPRAHCAASLPPSQCLSHSDLSEHRSQRL